MWLLRHGNCRAGQLHRYRRDGALPLGNAGAIRINTGGNSVLDNVISATNGDAVAVSSGLPADNAVIQGNLIGTDASGLQPLGNAGWGLRVIGSGLQIGGTGPGEGNVIAYNGGTPASAGGISIEGGTSVHNTIRGNSIHDNSGLGIDLNPVGATPNDEGDGDTGPNELQNFPVLSAVTLTAPTAESPRAEPGSRV